MVEINKAACIGCGKCVADCVSMSLLLKENKAEYTGQCIHCGHCVAVCPTGAVSIPEYDMADVQGISGDAPLTVDALLAAVKSRRSIRHYQERSIEQGVLENIVQAGRYTATAVNRQACRFIVVQKELERLKKLLWRDIEKAVSGGVEEAQRLKPLLALRREKGIDYLFRNAPAVLYIATENPWDAGLAAQNIELAAVAQGLGVLYNGYLVRSTPLSGEAMAFLQPEGKPLTACMLLGYPDVQFLRTAPRKKADVVWR